MHVTESEETDHLQLQPNFGQLETFMSQSSAAATVSQPLELWQ